MEKELLHWLIIGILIIAIIYIVFHVDFLKTAITG